MQVLSTIRPQAAAAGTSSAPNAAPDKSKKTPITPQDVVVKGAYLTGGALGGVGVGVVTGKVMSNLTGISLFSSVGGVAGAIGGAASAYSLSGKENKGEALARVTGSWVGGAVGSAAGQFVLGKAGEALVAAGASGYLGAAGPLVGTAVGGLAGAAIAMSPESRTGQLVKRAGITSVAATVGTYVGGFAQSLISTGVPELATAAALAPVVGGAAAGTIVNSFTTNSVPASASAYGAAAGTFGYGAGLLLGGLASNVTGSAFYTAGLPFLGMTTGILMGGGVGLEELRGAEEHRPIANKLFKGATVTAGTALGTVVGDAVGHGLQALTGNSIYGQAGQLVGGVNGLLTSLSLNEINTHKVAPTVLGTSAGVVGGAALGQVLSSISGQPVWNYVLPVLGGAAGGLGSLAAAIQNEQAAAKAKTGEQQEG